MALVVANSSLVRSRRDSKPPRLETVTELGMLPVPVPVPEPEPVPVPEPVPEPVPDPVPVPEPDPVLPPSPGTVGFGPVITGRITPPAIAPVSGSVVGFPVITELMASPYIGSVTGGSGLPDGNTTGGVPIISKSGRLSGLTGMTTELSTR
ncbi:hypothetical protein CF137_21245 [Aeromonas sobria]|nr:hypothetical protein CF137_21245 [Aeromonas sobria]